MKKNNQRKIKLKKITYKKLKKTLKIIYTSTTTLKKNNIFNIITTTTHLQITPVIKFYEKNFLNEININNFYNFINTTKLYNITNTLKQIDIFITKNLRKISKKKTLHLLTYNQIINYLHNDKLYLKKIKIFHIT